MAKSEESKIGDKLIDNLCNYTFNIPLLANYLISNIPMGANDRLMELVRYIIQYNSQQMAVEWEKGNTSEGLLLADALNDLIVALKGEPQVI